MLDLADNNAVRSVKSNYQVRIIGTKVCSFAI